jgi:hypothetical protein
VFATRAEYLPVSGSADATIGTFKTDLLTIITLIGAPNRDSDWGAYSVNYIRIIYLFIYLKFGIQKTCLIKIHEKILSENLSKILQNSYFIIILAS